MQDIDDCYQDLNGISCLLPTELHSVDSLVCVHCCRPAPSSGINELIVVTIIVASKGPLNIPGMNSQAEMQTSLNRLGALRSDQVSLTPAILLECASAGKGSAAARDVLHCALNMLTVQMALSPAIRCMGYIST